MRKTWKLHLAALAAAAALAAGCNADTKGEQRAAQDAESSSQVVSLTGCVATSPSGAGEYALQNVRLAPLGEQPSDAPTLTSNNAITEGSWVRLAMDENAAQLRERMGQRVTVTGRISDSGGATIGTSGMQAGPQQPEARDDKSRAAANEHHSEKVAKEAGPIGQSTMSNGTAPQLVVQRIEGRGEPCNEGVMQPENRR